ncbi:MAG TPA: redoxin domain-containing protein [Methylomirabilota bacterium]|nr:redoxin domain-containing protein [Methylomirabilota bacterium]
MSPGLLLAAAVLMGAVGAAPRQVPLKPDELAPDFTLVDQHGKPFRLSAALAGRDFVVLAFYVKAFTPAAEISNSPGSGTTDPGTRR